MVPVSTTLEFLLVKVRTALRRCLAESRRTELSNAFAAWILGDSREHTEFVSIVNRAAEKEGAQQDFQTVAILGFAAHSGMLRENHIEPLRRGLHRQAGREAFVDGIPMAFCLDAVGILGVAVGTKALLDVNLTYEVVNWFSKFLTESYKMRRTEDWQRCLFAAADRQLGGPLNLYIPKSPATADVRTALRARGLIDAGDGNQAQEDAAQTFNLAVQDYSQNVHFERLCLLLAAVESVTRKGWHPVTQTVPVAHVDGVDHTVNHASQVPKESRNAKNPLRRNVKYQRIDTALVKISAARPKNHEEVFRILDDRKIAIPNRKPFKVAAGWLKGFQVDRYAASAWLSQAWRRLGLPAFARGPKK